MHHSFIDQYVDRESVVHKIDPGVKIAGALLFITALVFTPIFLVQFFFACAFLILGLIFLSKVPLSLVLQRSLIVLPFVLLVAISIPFVKEGTSLGSLNLGLFKLNISSTGTILLINVITKAYLSVLTILIVITTTKFNKLLKGLEQLKTPKVLILVLSFLYRYIFVITDEFARIGRSIASRTFGKRRWFFELQTIGKIIGTLFLRSYERGERVYLAMLARGFTGEIKEIA